MQRPATTIECTPIVVDGRMYIATAQLQIRALDAATGKMLWNFDPFAGVVMRRPKSVNRGVAYWQDGEKRRIFTPAGADMYCLDADSGQPVTECANDGVLNMRLGLDRDIGAAPYFHASPPVIFKDLLILGGGASEVPDPAEPGHIRAFDLHTGKRRWIFHTIPYPREFGYDTWGKNNWKTAGGCNNWAGLSVDPQRAMVFALLGSPTFDFYGGNRPGQNLFGNSVLALDARAGERVWQFPNHPPRFVGLRFACAAGLGAGQAQRSMDECGRAADENRLHFFVRTGDRRTRVRHRRTAAA